MIMLLPADRRYRRAGARAPGAGAGASRSRSPRWWRPPITTAPPQTPLALGLAHRAGNHRRHRGGRHGAHHHERAAGGGLSHRHADGLGLRANRRSHHGRAGRHRRHLLLAARHGADLRHQSASSGDPRDRRAATRLLPPGAALPTGDLAELASPGQRVVRAGASTRRAVSGVRLSRSMRPSACWRG